MCVLYTMRFPFIQDESVNPFPQKIKSIKNTQDNHLIIVHSPD